MKTKILRSPMLFATAGALLCTLSAARAADASLEVRQDQSSTQKEVINEPSGADRSYSTTIQSTEPGYQSSTSRAYESGAQLDPDAEGDRIMHMYQRGRHAAESLDRQIKPNPIVVLPGAASVETFRTSQNYPPSHLGELHQQTYSSGFNEPAAAERESTTSSSTTTSRRYSTSDNPSETSSSTAMLSSGTTIKASDLMGMNIRNEQGEKIGEVKDVVLDLKSGRVAYAVVSAGGIAGLGDKWLAVPPTVFTRTGAEKTLTWNIDKDKLQAAPTIDKRNWNAAMQHDYIGTVYSYYGVQGYDQDSNLNEPAGTQKKDIQFHHDSEQQNQGQKQDRDQSRSDAELKGQASASTQSAEQSDLQKSQPERSAASSADVSKEAAGAESSSSVQRSYTTDPNAKSSADVNAPAGAASSSSSQEQQKSSEEQKSSSDVQAQPEKSSSSSSQSLNEPSGAAASSSAATSSEAASTDPMVEKVQMALKNDASLSGSAENVRFSMQNDKLVIKGTVKSEDEKNRILEKVRSTAGSTQIDDQLKVSASDDSSSTPESSSDSSSDNK